MLEQPEEAWFDVNMMQKDMLLAMELGRKLDVPVPTTALTNEFLTAARGMGWAKLDYAVIFDVLARMSGIETGSGEMTDATAHAAEQHTSAGGALDRRVPPDGRGSGCFEDQVNELYKRGIMPGLAHLYSGEEAIAVGVCEALNREDYITSTHRGHGHCLAKGAAPDLMFAELLGKEAGYCRGKGGSMHIADPATGNLGANAIVGGSFGIATGAAFAAQQLKNGRVAVCFFGEGALGQGLFYEELNLAQLWKLPVIYVCENNLYNEYTHFSESTAGDICARATAFGIHAETVDGQSVETVYATAKRLIDRARSGRVRHFCSAIPIATRATTWATSIANTTAPSRKSWSGRRSAIPSSCTARGSSQKGLPTRRRSMPFRLRASPEMKAAVEFAVAAPYPGPEEVEMHVYA